jgi:HlyD family secretion protein
MARTSTQSLSPVPLHPHPEPALTARSARWLVAILAAVTLAAIGASIEAHWRPLPGPPPVVLVAPVTRGAVTGLVKAEGALAPVHETVAAPSAGGRVIDLPVRVGDEVRRGQVLARLDPLAARAELARAQAGLVAAEVAAFEAEMRLNRLLREADRVEAQGLGLRDEQEDEQLLAAVASADARSARAAAAVSASEAVVRLARQRSKDTSIISPADGVIVALPIALGQVLDTGAPAVRIAGRDDHLKVTAFVDEVEIGRLKLGQVARLTVPAFPGRSYRVRIDRIGGIELGPDGRRRVALDLGVTNDQGDLRPGMSARVVIETRGEAGAMRVPVTALQFSPSAAAPDGRPAVWLAEGRGTSTALRQVPVEIRANDGELAEVIGPGLQEGAGVAVGYATTRAR